MSTRTTTARRAVMLRCSECGWTTSKWVGRCGECQAWGTVGESGPPPGARSHAGPVQRPAVPIGEVDAEQAATEATGVGEFDRVLGGGLVRGAVILLAGEPGIGKSTLLLDVAGRVAAGPPASAPTGNGLRVVGTPAPRRVLYVTGEESAAQVRLRAERIGALAGQLFLASESDLATVLGQIEQVRPQLLVLDSVQTIASAEIDGAAGNVAQVREVAGAIVRVAKEQGFPALLVGHVTKEGSIAGPRVLEHLVDVVCQFEGERTGGLRMVRAVKNRYGPTDEVGCFQLTDGGITGLADPSGLFLSQSPTPVPGSFVTVTMEGRRPLVAEVQSLVTPASAGNPRRTTQGLDSSRVAMLVAVLTSRAGLGLGSKDVFASTVGGVRLGEPAADLATALALAGAVCGKPAPGRTIAIGEVSLSGEVRRVPHLERRLAEAARLGFRRALVPHGSRFKPADGLQVTTVHDVAEAIAAVLSG